MAAYRVQVGKIRDRPYFVKVSAEPSLNEIQDFAVVLYYNDPDEDEQVQIARIDTAHDFVHVDELYAEEQGKEAFDGDIWEAQNYLEENWERFASLYRQNHE